MKLNDEIFAIFVQVRSMQMQQSRDLASSTKSFQDLLKLIENTNNTYKKHLANVNVTPNKKSQLIKDEMATQISKCQQEYDNIVSNNVKIISQNNNIIVLNYDINDIKQIVENKLITMKTTKYNDQFFQNYANIKFSRIKPDSLYSICQFDLKYTKLTKGSTIDCDDKHIKIGKPGHCYSMILSDEKHVHGYCSGEHCFRMYYKNPKGPHEWLFFGIYKYGIVPKDVFTYKHETSWGIVDNENGQIRCNGECEYDKSNMSFLYSLNENQIDMLIDFDNGILSYSIVDDNVKNRKYTFSKKFNTNIAYAVHLSFGYAGTEVQIAKINIDMFGKNKTFVKWAIEQY